MSTFIFDIDGTISQSGNPVAAEICELLVKLSQHHRIIFASARPVRDMLPLIAETLHSRALFIGCNGGMAYQDNQFIFSNTLERNYIEYALNILKEQHIPYVLDGLWGYAFSEQSHQFHNYIKSLSNFQENSEELIQKGVTKILVLTDKVNNNLISKLNKENISLHIHKNENFFDLTPQGNNKYQTIKNLLGEQNYIAFGNDQNDFLMLDHAEISTFVGNKNDYPNADYYTKVDEIVNVIKKISDSL